ncbi:MAG: G8 domain-containing protein, partial [Candidatus Binataceae bacterium]
MIDGSVDSSAHAAATPITSCIVNAANDVAIGAGAPAGCSSLVVLAPSPSNPPALGEVTIGAGGTLSVIGQAGTLTAQTNLTHRLIQTLGRALSWPAVAHAQSLPAALPSVMEICVADGGTLQIGAAGAPITSANKVLLNFIGDRSMEAKRGACKEFAKGIDVNPGGALLMYGAKGVPQTGGISWTTLSAPAGLQVPGAAVPTTFDGEGHQLLQLTDDVTKGPEPWQPGDWIVVGTSSFSPFETEFVKIAIASSRSGGGSTLTLSQPLVYYHFGSLAPSTGTCVDRLGKTEPASFCDDATHNYGVDERAEVGLISRDIELSSVVPADPKS